MSDKPEMREIATTADGRDVTRGYVDPMAILLPQDTVLTGRGGGSYELYREVLRDDQVASVFQQRRRAVVAREWEVVPGGDRRQDKAAADALREWLSGVNLRLDDDEFARLPQPGWDAITDRMLYGVFYGFSMAECIWGRDGRHVTLDAIRVRDRRRFGFDGRMRPRLYTAENPNGELLPARKFWSFCTGADHDDEPYGLGLAHWLYWPVFFKRNGVKFWLIFLEKFGQPTATGKYPNNADAAEKRKLLQTLRAIHTDSGVIIPEGMAIELIEAARSGTADYTALYDRMNAAITKVVLGHTGASDSTPGKLGSEDMAQDVRLDLVKADADLICDSFNRTVARWLTEWNYPNARPPRVWRKVEDAEDLNQVAEREKRIFDMGFRPTLRHIEETYGGEWEAAPDAPPAFAESEPSPAPDATAAQLERLQRAGDAEVEKWVEKIRELVMEVDSLEALRDRLIELYPDLDPDGFARVMGDALAAAHLAGRYDILEGV